MDACITIYPPKYGRHIKTVPTQNAAIEEAADWYMRWQDGQITHENVEIKACKVQYDGYTPTGLKAFDEARKRSSGIATGNVYSNVQFSTFVQSFFTTKNGHAVLDEGEMYEARIRELAHLKASGFDRVKRALAAAPFLHDPHPSHRESMANVHFIFHHHGPQHDRQRTEHGWIITGPEQELVARIDLSHRRTSLQIMDQATYVLTGQHEDSKPLLLIKDNQVQFVAAELDAAVAAMREETSESVVERPRMG